MGLLLSTLVFCVGVIELITFFHNVRRHVVYPPVTGRVSNIRDSYIQELRKTRRKLIEDLQKLKNTPKNESSEKNKFVIRDDFVTNSILTFRLNSDEDIEKEYNESITRSKSSSPRRFLVTKKERSGVETFISSRRFVVSDEAHALRKSKSQSDLPEFLIRECNNPDTFPNKLRYMLQEQQTTDNGPIPLPRQFIVSETDLNTVVFQDDKVDSTNRTEYIRRSPSPFPLLEHSPNPRNSLCNEMLDYLSLDSVQEEQKSRSPSPNTVIENVPQEQKIIYNKVNADLSSPGQVKNINFNTKIISNRIISKSELNNSESSSLRVLDTELRASAHSELSDHVQELSKIELELEEALEECVMSKVVGSPQSSSNVKASSSSRINERKNVSSNNELGIIS